MQVINLIFVVAFAQVGMSQESVFRWRLCPFLRNLHIEKARDKANNGIPVNQSLYQACLRGAVSDGQIADSCKQKPSIRTGRGLPRAQQAESA